MVDERHTKVILGNMCDVRNAHRYQGKYPQPLVIYLRVIQGRDADQKWSAFLLYGNRYISVRG